MQRGKPFFSGNYGSALGSTANAANLIAQAGQAQGQMFANLGKIAGESIQKYSENKKKKEEEKQTASFIKNYLKSKPDVAAQFGIKGDNLITFEEAVDQGANAIAKNPKGVESIKGLMEIQRSNAEEVRKAKAFEKLIAQSEGQLEMANIDLAPQPPTYTDPGGTFNANTGNKAGDRSTVQGMQNFLKNNPNLMPKTPEGKIQLANRFRDIRGANVPKPLSPSEDLALKKYQDEKAKDEQETETAKIKSTNNLTDFYNETKSLLDKINKKGVDVTGPIEGTSIYRFFSKLGDTDDEQVRRRLEMFTRKLTLDAAQNLAGALSDKDIRFLVEQAPDMDDNPSVWKKYMGDLVLRLERNANQQGIELGQPALASQSLLEEVERKRQLKSKRAGL